jgi:hypothetical protein
MVVSQQQQHKSQFKFQWEYLLATAVLSSCSAFLISSLAATKPERYSQLIVGAITWNSGLKQPDYVLLFSLVIGFFVIYIGLDKLSQAIRRINGEPAETAFRSLLVYALIPGGMVIGRILVALDQNIVEFLVASLAICSLTILFATVLAAKRLPVVDPQEYTEAIGGSLLVVLFSSLMGSTIAFAIGRIAPAWQFVNSGPIAWLSVAMAVLLWIPLGYSWVKQSQSLTRLRSKVRFLLWVAQATFPLFFLVLLPDLAMIGGVKAYSYTFTLALPILISLCSIIVFVDWLRRFESPFKSELGRSVFSAISPIGMIALLLYMKAPIQGLTLLVDDYHVGEFLLPWHLWQHFKILPFWDYEPARGLINYVPGMLANIFYGDTAVAYQSVFFSAVWILPFLGITFGALYQTIGLMPAFLSCLLMPMNTGLNEHDCLMVVVLCILGQTFLARAWTRWLMIWAILGICLILVAPAQALLLLLSTLPLVGFALFQALRKERKTFRSAAGMGIAILLLGSWLTPLGKMLFGAVRYVIEQSAINSTAHGIAWSESLNKNLVLSYPLWETIRSAWIPIGILAGLFVLKALVDKGWSERSRYLVFGLPILLLTILLIPRAAGRIDPGGLSRLGIASTMAVCLFLPIILLTAYGPTKKARSLFIVAFLGGVLIGMPLPVPLFAKPAQVVNMDVSKLKNADALGLPNLAHTLIDPIQFARLAKIKPVLAAVVDPGETYLDLTNHNAQYFYLGYRFPIQGSALYNLPHHNQQIRAVKTLEVDPPPIVLASAENLIFDGGPASLRAHLLYRYVVEHYTPVKIESFIYLVRPDRLPRLLAQFPTATGTAGSAERLDLLDEIFKIQDLQAIPRAWGASFETLKSELQLVKQIPQTTIPRTNDLEKAESTDYRDTGPTPFIVYDIGDLKLNGRDAGVLVFDLEVAHRTKPIGMKVYWGSQTTGVPSEKTGVQFSARNGKIVVPLDAAPRWLLAEGVNAIQINLLGLPPGQRFSIKNVALFQRTGIGNL